MTELNKSDWITEADKFINDVLINALHGHLNGSWEENHITTNALNAIGSLGKKLKWNSQNQSTVWESYKQSGVAETTSGDILFFIKVILSSEVAIEGVVYYEAKKMYLNDKLEPIGYSAFKLNQLARIMGHSPASNILLYNVSHTLSANGETAEYSFGSFALPTVFTYSLFKGPQRFSGQNSKSLPDFGKSWASFLADNFSGFGLDYNPEVVRFARNYISVKHKALPANIVIATTSKAPEIEPELDRSVIPANLFQRTNLPDDTPPTPDSKNRRP